MLLPLIYSNEVQADPDTPIHVFVEEGSIGSWTFENAEYYDIVNLNGNPLSIEELEHYELSFKCLIPIDPLIIKYVIKQNSSIRNGTDWTSDDDTIANQWSGGNFQTNEVLSGWNFVGNSQRVIQNGDTTSSLYQDNLVALDNEYSFSFKYRSTCNFTAEIGDNIFEINSSEDHPFIIFPILHGSGTLDVEAIGDGSTRWILSDGSYLFGERIVQDLPAGTSYLVMDSFEGSDIDFWSTGVNYVGSLSDIPYKINSLELENTNVVGDLSEIDHITNVVHISNCDIVGDIASLSGVASIIDLNGCLNISGDLGVLNATDVVILSDCAIGGIIKYGNVCKHWELNDTTISQDDLTYSLINIANTADLFDINEGHFECNTGTISGVEGCNALFTLEGKDWHVEVNSSCYFG